MTLTNTDKLVVNRAGLSYSVNTEDVYDKVLSSDVLLVNRNGVTYKITGENFFDYIRLNPGAGGILDTDLFLANRNGLTYKVSALDVRLGVGIPVLKPSVLQPADGFSDAQKNPFVTSSDFTSEIGLTHASTDWQVTTDADTEFTSPLVESLVDTLNLTSWQIPTDLEPETTYRTRVRYRANNGEISEWSDVNVFTTTAFFVITSQVGKYWIVSGGIASQVDSGDVEFFNAVETGGHTIIAIGTDFKLYATTGIFESTQLPDPFQLFDDSDTWISLAGDYAFTGIYAMNNLGEVYHFGPYRPELIPDPSSKQRMAPGVTFFNIGSMGTWSGTIWAQAKNGDIYTGTGDVSGINPVFQPLNVTIPAGEVFTRAFKLRGIGTISPAENYLFLSDTGTIWCAGDMEPNLTGAPSGGTLSNLLSYDLPLVNGKVIEMNCPSIWDDQTFTFLTDQNELAIAASADAANFGALDATALRVVSGSIASVAIQNWRMPFYAIHTDGGLYQLSGDYSTWTRVEPQRFTNLKSFGGLGYSYAFWGVEQPYASIITRDGSL
jgi:hypothetical protein